MITPEFDLEFDLLYDAASKGAPDIDKYEKSVYLTTAQEEIVKSLYSGWNKEKESFESNEKRRRVMNELVKSYSQSTHSISGRGLTKDSVFFAIPTNVYYIVHEKITLSKPGDSCIHGKEIMVKPITHDQFSIDYKNPFRRPNRNKAWRIDISKEGSNPLVEIISSESISEYSIRYVKEPKPIIIQDLQTGDFNGLGLSINGKTAVTECELNSEVHREILNRAVELAIRDYRENSLKTKIETNNRV